MNSQTDLDRFLKMSIHNPEFVYYAEESKWEARRRVDTNQMTLAQYEKYIALINEKTAGKYVKPMDKAFKSFKNVTKDDGMVEYLEEDVLQEVLTARETCEKFIALLNHPKFEHGERVLLNYMITLIKKMSEAIKADSEECWDIYKSLKHYAMWSVAKNLVPRNKMGLISTAIKTVIGNEIRVIKQFLIDDYKSSNNNKMTYFEKMPDPEEYINVLDNLPEIVEGLLTKTPQEARAIAKPSMDLLDQGVVSGKLVRSLNLKLTVIIRAHCHDFLSGTLTPDYIPLMYLRKVQDGAAEMAGLSLYTKREMAEAFTYAKAFANHFSNESLKINILEAMLQNDLIHLGNVIQVNQYLKELYQKSVELLSNYDILTTAERISYDERGRTKFYDV